MNPTDVLVVDTQKTVKLDVNDNNPVEMFYCDGYIYIKIPVES